MNDPRPRITSARPFEIASTVAKRWKTRTGSSELSTVTPEAKVILWVRVAMPASTVSGLEIEYSGRWCSPSAIPSTPAWSARTASSMTCRMAAACETGSPESATGTSPKVSRPITRLLLMILPSISWHINYHLM